jgi:MoaA/NifB/PqqE/SkfB family radical SAM enzyme
MQISIKAQFAQNRIRAAFARSKKDLPRKSMDYARLAWARLFCAMAPERARAKSLLGRSLIALGHKKEGVAWLKASLSGKSKDGQEFLTIAHALIRLSEFKSATKAFERAVALSPNNARLQLDAARHFRGWGLRDKAAKSIARARELDPRNREIERLHASLIPSENGAVNQLDFVIIGGIGLCNASCVHCPTGKSETSHVPRTPMPWDLFCRLIDELKASNLPIVDGFVFGLFGDSLVDPLVVERARYARQQFPDLPICISTNGAAYDPGKHGMLDQYATTINLHCESLDEGTYNHLMAPLRLKRTLPKIEMMIRDFSDKIVVSVPVSQRNCAERDEMHAKFIRMGAKAVLFASLSARCSKDQSVFNSLAFDPQQIACSPRQLNTLTIDCDGTVLACCTDFAREEPLGKFGEQSLMELLNGPRRRQMMQDFADGNHACYSTCSRCRADTVIPENWSEGRKPDVIHA